MPTIKTKKPKEGRDKALHDLLYKVLETEMGGVQVYRTALRCAVLPELKAEWTEFLRQTERHVEVSRQLLRDLDLDPEIEEPARMPVRTIGLALVSAMEQGLASGDLDAAQLTAAECVVDAETRDHENWSILGKLADATQGQIALRLKAAFAEVEAEEDRHLYYSSGWARELCLRAVGLPAELPPPEEKRDATSQAAAAEAKEGRKGAAAAKKRPTAPVRTK